MTDYRLRMRQSREWADMMARHRQERIQAGVETLNPSSGLPNLSDPTRWVREMFVGILSLTDMVQAVEDQGRATGSELSGNVFFTDKNGLNYDILIGIF